MGRKVPVSRRALIQRLNRKLAPHEKLFTWRSSGGAYRVGDLYRMDVNRHILRDERVNLEALARELGALQPWEALAE